MTGAINRRDLLAGAAAVAAAGQPALARAAIGSPAIPSGVELGPAQPFSFESLKQRARAAAGQTYSPPGTIAPAVLKRINYDAYQDIRYRRNLSVMLDGTGRVPVQFFHLADMLRDRVRIHIVDGSEAREVIYRTALFDIPDSSPARDMPEGAGFAGFRIMAPGLETDWLAFAGASYFRSSGPYDQYGLSARALAIDTGLATPEEFPRFTEFWLERGTGDGAACVVSALLDSPRVTGAYRMSAERTSGENDVFRVAMTIDAELYCRGEIQRLGVAPFSSMFWYGEAARTRGADWRPEIHDSDGLALWTGSGERIWRPLNNPPRVMTNSFVDRDVRGFGLLQRDRDFVHYLDDSVFYERRPSVWVEPIEGWGEGAVQLVEIPTDDEIHDNIAAYWCPTAPFRAGEQRRYRYRLSWVDDIPFPPKLGWATATFTGLGGRPGHKRPEGVRKFVIDFQGPVFAGIGRDDGVEIVVTPSRGTISNAYTHPVAGQRLRWRALFDLTVDGADPVDIRAYLRLKDRALTETWVYQHFPEA